MRAWQWERPDSESLARKTMVEAEARGDYEVAALAALTYADYISVRTIEGAASMERQALVYASLNRADVALFIAENRQPWGGAA